MIIFVGDKPSPKMKPGARPFEGAACANRLNTWIQAILKPVKPRTDATTTQYMLINRIDWEIGPLSSWSKNKHSESKFVALGIAASKTLSNLGVPHFKLPHPSGRNRQINNKAFIEKKLKECRKWLKSQQK